MDRFLIPKDALKPNKLYSFSFMNEDWIEYKLVLFVLNQIDDTFDSRIEHYKVINRHGTIFEIFSRKLGCELSIYGNWFYECGEDWELLNSMPLNYILELC